MSGRKSRCEAESLFRSRMRRVPGKMKSPCWEWTRCRGSYGYGKMGSVALLRSSSPGDTHRIAWMLKNGPIPKGMCVLHHCDNPPCCNPSHLFLGTKADNNIDRQLKGRSIQGDQHWARLHPGRVLRGVACPWAKLTNRQVSAIRSQYIRGKIGYKRLGKKFGVSWQLVALVVKGKVWKHLTKKEKANA